MQLILASSSPRRKELLKKAKIPFEQRTQHTDEKQVTGNTPEQLVKNIAIEKGNHVPILSDQEIILTADTVVTYENQVLGKPESVEHAYQILTSLSGKTHTVMTAVLLKSTKEEQLFIEKTIVEFWELTDEEIHEYIQTGDCFDKAGAYGIQSEGFAFVKKIHGDYYNVVGLPISRLIRELRPFAILPVST
ncbi:Maf family protein [Salirhabdus salicampi]|uniref:Maf family protein n=1 Tax=Salirhabdus salicampi TaxID=476102 RepID=UPI0020C35BA4|nr:Maf family protein [Salirhabdus salicampi]MCP8617015.1 Maf family protein [Salirhabdus salicampi]